GPGRRFRTHAAATIPAPPPPGAAGLYPRSVTSEPPAAGRTLRLGSREWPPGSFGIMAVINRTPDSFFDHGTTYEPGPAPTAGGLAPRTRPHRPAYADVVAEVRDYVTAEAERAVAAGVRPDGIVIDPAHDFGKNTWQSLELTRRTGDLVATGWPVLVAVSNKDFVGETLDLP